ncbi:LytTR family DNA-binding domain-containing protein [Telluribacter sp. SYSU D00476]|uniref:LytR/AlgR family response regulator transcription factor n=1 Tax=Telluribacter sp. SYSU D00476 TaxID=2811430 RepID=UPI001FF2EA1B|nr:LytTR family DNA-binding domain-containing protein [Telluribacter sp. SYSU D00476]
MQQDASINTTPPTLPTYHDKWIQVIGIPVIAAFAHYLTYNYERFEWIIAYEYISDCLKIFLIWRLMRGSIIWLDKRYPWQQNFVVRLLIQLVLTNVVSLSALTALVFAEYAFIRPYQMEHFFSLDLVIAFLFILFGNAIYICLYFYDSYKRSEDDKRAIADLLQAAPSAPPMEHVTVRTGKKEVLVPIHSILCMYSEEKETYLIDLNQKVYLLDHSLDRLQEQLPEALFFRANRQFIVTPRCLQSVATDAYGKLTVTLTPNPKLPETITISRQKAPAFRQWMKR